MLRFEGVLMAIPRGGGRGQEKPRHILVLTAEDGIRIRAVQY